MSRFVASELVWVKLGGVQWPAVVKDKADCEEFLDALKRDPIAVVEFFDKKLHDVHNGSHICRYNCEEKEDIIMRSLQLTRNKPDISENFKKDVITAEKITDGDLHILSKSRFIIPTRKKHDDLFGKAKKSLTKPSVKKKISKTEEASPKKSSKYSDIFPESAPRNRKLASKPKKVARPAVESPRLNITHPRFIAENDHEIRILAADSPPANAGDRQYRCSQCGFTTARLNVLVLHNKTHVAAAAKRKTTDSRTDAPAAKKPKKKHVDAGSEISKQASGKADRGTNIKKTSRPSTPAKKNAAGEGKKAGKVPSKNVPPGVKNEAEKPKTPLKVSPLKPAGSSKPLLIDDWDEDDDEEVAERLKIQSEIDRFINDRRSGDGTSSAGLNSLLTASDDSEERTASGGEETAVELAVDSAPPPGEKASAPGESVTAPAAESVTTPAAESVTTPAVEPVTTPAKESVTTPVAEPVRAPTAESVTAPAAESVRAPAVEPVTESAAAALRQRNDALLQAAVDDVLADTAPVRLPTLPPGAETPRPRPLRLCPPSDDVTSSPSDVSSTTLPANLQILSVPGGAGQPDTYALVSVDDTGNVQTVNPMESLQGLGADTLLAYEVVQEDGSTRTAYLNPSALSSGSDIKHLLGGDGCKADSSTPVPDSSGK